VSGALAERVFVKKLGNVGFTDIEVVERHPFRLADAARYPLFTPDLIELMHELLPQERHDEVATGVTIRARRS
jgi:arsenite methyltransferase